MHKELYGNRDHYLYGTYITRPDGSGFYQGIRDTYRYLTLPPVTRPAGYWQDYGSRSRRGTGLLAERVGRILTDGGSTRILTLVSREDDGIRWTLTFEDEYGTRVTTSRLKHAREGNG
jgi:hypothetical protein